MSQSLTVDFFDLASVRVAKYSVHDRLGQATVRFKVQSNKTRQYRYYETVVTLTPDLVSNAVGGDVAAAVKTAAWQVIYVANQNDMMQFVGSETKKPGSSSAYQVPTVFPPAWITTSVLGDFEADLPLSLQLVATLGTEYQVSAGTLPAGVSLNQLTGELFGTPSATGLFAFDVDVIGAAPSLTATRSFSIRIANAPAWVTASALQDASTGTPLSVQLTATDATSYVVVSGTLPPGTSLTPTGIFAGTPLTPGIFVFEVFAALGSGSVGSLGTPRQFTMAVGTLPVWQTAISLDDAPSGVPFSRTLAASNAVEYALFSGTLPVGSTLTSGGSLSGTPNVTGAYVFTIKAVSAAPSVFSTRSFSMRVETPPTWVTGATLPAFATNSSVNVALSATLAYSYAVVGGSVPNGLSLSQATGTLSGAALYPGDYTFVVRAYSPAPNIFTDRAFGMQVANTPIWITTAVSDSATGVQVTAQLNATHAVQYVVESGDLPAGMSLSTGGLITGAPNAPGSFTVTVRAVSAAASVFTSRSFTFAVQDAPEFSTASPLLQAQTGVPQSRAFVASNTSTYSLFSGALPTGMTLSATGAFFGTPNSPGTYSFVVRAVSPSSAVTTNRSFTILVASKPVWSTGAALVPATTGLPLSTTLVASTTVSYQLTAGALPDGVTLGASGLLSGSPNLEGTYVFTVSAVSASPAIFTEREFTLVVADAPIWATDAALPAGASGEAYSLQLSASMTTAYALQSGTFPAGITLTSGGLISGTAVSPATFVFTLRAVGSAINVYTERTFTLVIASRPVWSTPQALPGVAANETLATALTASNAVSYSVTSGALPPGTVLSASGSLGGTPSATGPYSFVVRAVSVASTVFADRTFSVDAVNRPAWVSPASLPDVLLGAAQSLQLQATNATGYVLSSGSPPSGCVVASNGLLSGTTIASSTFTFTIRATTSSPDVSSSRTFTQIVGVYPTWVTGQTVDVALQSAVSRQLAATGAATFALASGALPAGVTLSSTGLLSGSTSSAGEFAVTVRAASVAPTLFTDREIIVKAAAIPVWTTDPTVPDVAVGVAMTPLQLNATSAVTYVIAGGALPPGTALTLSGLLSGTVSAAGVYTFVVRAATSAQSVFADRSFTFRATNFPVWVTPAALADRTRGSTFSIQLSATGATTYSRVSGTLPTGVVLTSIGGLSGTPNTSGLTTFTVRAFTSSTVVFTDRTFTLLVSTQPTWTTSAALADMATSAAVNLQLLATESASFVVVSGTVPPGLSVASNGVLSGSPTTDGTYSFSVRAFGASLDSYADRTFVVSVGTTPVWTTAVAIQDSVVGGAIAVQLAATNAVSYSAAGVPAGLSVSSTGLLTGAPVGAGSFTMTVRAVSIAPTVFTDRSFTLRVSAQPAWVTAPLLVDVPRNVALTVRVIAVNTSTYSIASGAVPAGLSFSSAGFLTGTPLIDGPYSFTIRATSSSPSIFTDRVFSLLVETLPTWATSSTLTDSVAGEAYSRQLIATDVDNFSFRSGALPTGLNLSSNGLLSGTSTTAGSYSFTIRAESTSSALYIDRTFTLLMANRPSWNSPGALPEQRSGTLFLLPLSATFAQSYSVISGVLPGGSTMSSAGVISAASPVAATSVFTVRAFGSSSIISSDREFTLRFVRAPTWQTASTLTDVVAGTPLAVTLTALDAQDYSSADPLPPGLTLSSSGLLSGTPTTAGSYAFEVVAENSSFSADRTFNLTVQP